jgi:hypothetical protein
MALLYGRTGRGRLTAKNGGFRPGQEMLTHAEEPRLKFKGVLEVNPDTGRQQMVAESPFMQSVKKIIGFLVVLVMVVLTMSAGTLAMLLRYAGDGDCPDGGCPVDPTVPEDSAAGLSATLNAKKFEIASSFSNLFVIITFGMMFEWIAIKLNNFENHRTEAEYANALVLKNFMFQFVNNYFTLFYIAFMREIPDPFSKKPHPCEGGSCLSELQMQLIVVFSAKTVGIV